jgi:hypothetical protein
MKNLLKILAVVGIMTTIIPFAALAEASDYDVDEAYEENEIDFELKEKNEIEKPKKIYKTESCKPLRLGKIKDVYQCVKSNDQSKRNVIFKGIWGFSDDNESDGYFAGKIACGHKLRIFKGFYNKTDNETKGRIIGVLKNGYFNGKIISPEGSSTPIVGLFKVDRENKTLKMKWMTVHSSGWAAARLTLKV